MVFEDFMKLRERAARAYVTGDMEALSHMVTLNSPATFFGPGGGYVEGAEAVLANYGTAAKPFQAGSTTEFEILQMGDSGNIAYWVGIQRATVFMGDNPKPVDMELRVTEIFRKEGEDWKLVHRHADMPKPS